MAKDESVPKAVRSYGQHKKTKTLRFTPETFKKLRAASVKSGLSETAYVEQALKAQFKKDGIE
jgi:hypothetical protein